MPIHDWTRVSSGIFHHFHSRWISAIGDALNKGVLPEGYYALAEQIAGEIGPDVLALESSQRSRDLIEDGASGILVLDEAPPQVSIVSEVDEIDLYAIRQNALVIRHSSDHTVVAILEIVSEGNKARRPGLERFVRKAISALAEEIHLLVIDLHPPGKYDPEGIHGAIWGELTGMPFAAPPGKPLTLASYYGIQPFKAYVEPIAVGAALPDMPLFLAYRRYINVPLEKTYLEAYAGVPKEWRHVLEGKSA
jgi:hypothetical protein